MLRTCNQLLRRLSKVHSVLHFCFVYVLYIRNMFVSICTSIHLVHVMKIYLLAAIQVITYCRCKKREVFSIRTMALPFDLIYDGKKLRFVVLY